MNGTVLHRLNRFLRQRHVGWRAKSRRDAVSIPDSDPRFQTDGGRGPWRDDRAELYIRLLGYREKSNLLHEFVNGTNAALCLMTCQGRVITANSAWTALCEELFGLGPGPIQPEGRHYFELVAAFSTPHGLQPGELRDQVCDGLSGSGGRGWQARFLCGDGNRPVLVDAFFSALVSADAPAEEDLLICATHIKHDA